MSNKINKAQFNKLQSLNGAKKMVNNSEITLDKMLDKLLSRIEREVPEYGNFAPVYEFIKNNDSKHLIDRFQLNVFKMPKHIVEDEKRRYIEAAVYSKAGDYKATLLLGSGNKEEIIKQLKSDEFLKKLDKTYLQLTDMILNP